MSIKNKIESILLLGGDEVKIKDLAKHFSMSIEAMTNTIRELRLDRKDTGINIAINGEMVSLTTNPKYGSVVNSYFEHEWHPRKLSSAAMETICIIAYNQPITKGEILAIRGVPTVDNIILGLKQRELIRVCGKKKTKGNPSLYEVTDKFLGYIGIDSIDELPKYQDLKSGEIYNEFKNAQDAIPLTDEEIAKEQAEAKAQEEAIAAQISEEIDEYNIYAEEDDGNVE